MSRQDTEPTLLDLLAPAPRSGSSTATNRSTPAKPPMADWLLEHLVATGHMSETGLTRRARLRACHCGARTLSGLDADRLAFEAHCDPVPLTALGEAMAVIEDRLTFELHRAGDYFELEPRDHRRITWSPAGSRPRLDVLRAHRCRTPPVPAPLAAPTSFGEVRAVHLPPDAPAPF